MNLNTGDTLHINSRDISPPPPLHSRKISSPTIELNTLNYLAPLTFAAKLIIILWETEFIADLTAISHSLSDVL